MSYSPAGLCACSPCFGYQKVEKLFGLPCYSSTSRGQQKHVPVHAHINFWRSSSVDATSRPLARRVCQVKSGDSEGYVGHDSVILHQQMLEKQLENAIAKENYAEAAKIRDHIKNLHEDSEASVLAANGQFYNSFRSGDITAMQKVWSRGDNACCVHPGSLGICGYESVIDSWNVVWANYEFPLEIELRDVRVHVKGELGYVTCIELVKTKGSSWGGQYVTNVFEKVDGRWLICIHHASPFDF